MTSSDRASENPTESISPEQALQLAQSSANSPLMSDESIPVPTNIGRYRIVKLLGQGGYGRVLQAFDEDLKRDVAIKISSVSKASVAMRESFQVEAQALASLDHPNIVPVYDFGQTPEGDFYLVSKLIDGLDLAQRIILNRPDRALSLSIVEKMADALSYAHSKGLVHRDVKPANILLDRSDKPYLGDFGIALRESDYGKPNEYLGTPAYMSPEQARDEGHLVDNGSDIYSLGVVLYELLTGRLPFRAEAMDNLMQLVATQDVRSPRTFDNTIHPQLERICLRALARIRSNRYSIAGDLAEDIRWILKDSPPTPGHMPAMQSLSEAGIPVTPRGSDSRSEKLPADKTRDGATRIVPKGLRSFDAEDSDFFLNLLPGPFDREGLPKGLRFWKTRTEETTPERTFRVGLIYGPSGCGKSSLMKAGLLPRLSSAVLKIYLEASPDDTEIRLIRAVRNKMPDAEGSSLKELLSCIRRRKLVPTNGKLLLVIDQFEQWLFAEKDYATATLTDAFRHCDGVNIQAIVLVRDDFWLSVSRFFQELDIRILEDENSTLVDLFDQEHASKVLGLFGCAYGKLPESLQDWGVKEKEFVRQAIDGLSQDRRVISVRIAVLAEMLKSRDWTAKTLRDLGGIDGIGVTFLEEMFGSRHAPIEHRRHQEAVRGLLSTILPAKGSDIRGSKHSIQELRKAAGYEHKPAEFNELMSILERKLRLLTAVDDRDAQPLKYNDPNRITGLSLNYQLAHDYLVPSLREWLTRKQRETKKGRAELKLAERAATWGANQENKQLPTLWEWLQIRLRTDRKRWTPGEIALMQRAGKVNFGNWGSVISILILSGILMGYVFQQKIIESQKEKIKLALDSLQEASGTSVAGNIERLKEMGFPDLISRDLKSRYRSADDHNEKISLALGLSHFGHVNAEYLLSQLDSMDERNTNNLVQAFSNDTPKSLNLLKNAYLDCIGENQYRKKARLALIALGLGDTELSIDACEFNDRKDHGLRTQFIDLIPFSLIEPHVLMNTVKDVSSPALRSAVSLGIGQIPVKQVSKQAREVIAKAARELYYLNDSSTHNAARWLMQQWEIPDPVKPSKPVKIEEDGSFIASQGRAANTREIVGSRKWFVNSLGATFIKIEPPINLVYDWNEPDIEFCEFVSGDLHSNFKTAGDAYLQIASLYFLGEYERVINKYRDGMAFEEYSPNRYRILYYAFLATSGLKRSLETPLVDHSFLHGEERKLLDPIIALCKGEKDIANQKLSSIINDYDSLANETDYDPSRARIFYDIAVLSCIFAESEITDLGQRRKWVVTALRFLKTWLEESMASHESFTLAVTKEPAFVILRNEPEFNRLCLSIPKKAFWLCSCEVTNREFAAFHKENFDKNQRLFIQDRFRDFIEVWNFDEPNDPVASDMINFDIAAFFCNWLSERENRTCVYEWWGEEITRVNKGMTTTRFIYHWRINADASGYRLPDYLEWEYACRAGSTTKWSPGNDVSLLSKYCQMYSINGPTFAGFKMPNAWGLFDMHGNVDEICWPPSFYNLGGNWADYPHEVGGKTLRGYSNAYYHLLEYHPANLHGFRIVLNSP